MELIYTTQRTGFVPGKAYANARYFAGIRADVTRVVVIGHHPHIVAAYEAAGIEVEVVGQAEPVVPKILQAPLVSEARPPAVDIPDNWRDLPWSRPAQPGGMTMRGLVKQLGGVAANGEQAREFIQGIIDERC